MNGDTTVFVVDDDDAVRDALAMMLPAAGRSVETFASASDFAQRGYEHRSGCLVLDVRMPGMSGLELQDWLGGPAPALPIVFLTGHGDVPMAVRALKRGAHDFIQKPVDDRDLLDAIDLALARNAAPQSTANARTLPPSAIG